MRQSWRMTIGGGLVVLGAALGVAIVGAAVPAARAQQPGTPLQELAERLLAAPFPGPGGGPLPEVQLLPGQVPSDLPVALPLPPGGRLVGSMVSGPSGPKPAATTIVLDAPGSQEDLVAFFDRVLSEQGWTRGAGLPMPYRQGGFQVSAPFGGTTYCPPAGPQAVTVTAYPEPSGLNDVRFSLQTGSSLCSPPPVSPQPPQLPQAATLIPSLSPPPGVVLQGGSGGGGGPNRWSSDATAETTRGPAELEAYFAQQLAAAGWTRQDGRTDGRLAWSAWTIPSEGDWRGLLIVAEWPEANRRLLTARVESPTLSPYGSGGIVTFGSGTYYPGPAGPVPVPPTAPPAPAPAVAPLAPPGGGFAPTAPQPPVGP